MISARVAPARRIGARSSARGAAAVMAGFYHARARQHGGVAAVRLARSGLAHPAEHVVGLRGHAHEGGALRDLLEVGRADIGHHRAHAAHDLAHRAVDRAAVGRLDRLALGGAIMGDAARMLLHRRLRRHAVERHADRHLLAVALLVADFAVAFVVAGEHAAQHDEIGARAVRLGDVARHGAAAVGADLALEPVRGVGAFDDRRELRIADPGHPPGGADRARADADLDDVGAGEDQRFRHVAGDDVAGHDDGVAGSRRARA